MDASTTVGYAFVDGKEVIDLGFIPIQKEKSIRDKVQLTMDTITELDPFDQIEQIYIEDVFLALVVVEHHNRQSLNPKFNAVLVYCLEFAYGEIVDGINPMTTRKTSIW